MKNTAKYTISTLTLKLTLVLTLNLTLTLTFKLPNSNLETYPNPRSLYTLDDAILVLRSATTSESIDAKHNSSSTTQDQKIAQMNQKSKSPAKIAASGDKHNVMNVFDGGFGTTAQLPTVGSSSLCKPCELQLDVVTTDKEALLLSLDAMDDEELTVD